MKKTKKNKGFTLVELIVVIAVLVILAAILIPTMTGVINDAKEATGNANARTVYTAATAYVAKQYPNKVTGPLTSTQLATYLGAGFGTAYQATITTDGQVETAEWNDGTTTYVYTASTGAFTTETESAIS